MDGWPLKISYSRRWKDFTFKYITFLRTLLISPAFKRRSWYGQTISESNQIYGNDPRIHVISFVCLSPFLLLNAWCNSIDSTFSRRLDCAKVSHSEYYFKIIILSRLDERKENRYRLANIRTPTPNLGLSSTTGNNLILIFS